MRRIIYLILFSSILCFSSTLHAQVCSSGAAQTFTNSTPVNIVDNSVVTSTITVSGAPTFIYDVNMITNITHTFAGDLDITITSPAGTVVTLTSDNGGGNDNVFAGTTWDDAANPAGQVPYTNNNGLVTDHTFTNLVVATPLAPEEALGAFVGENPNGVWTLRVGDDAGGDVGVLNSWSLVIKGLSAAPTLTTTTGTNTTPVSIVDNTVVSSTITIAGAGTQIFDVNLLTNITHTFAGDLDITITSPAGTVVTLTTDNGGGNDNVFAGTTWDDNANPGGQLPYTTNDGLATDHNYLNLVLASPLAPEEPLAAFIGENPNGVWTIRIGDDAGGDIGTLNSWGLTIKTSSCPPATGPCGALPIQTFSNPAVTGIPDDGVATSTITVAGAPSYLYDITVLTNLTHTFSSDLDITITSPAGTIVTLTTDNGGSNDNVFNGTVWDDKANPGGVLPYTNNDDLVTEHAYTNGVAVPRLVPEEPLSAFLGENPNGVWTITISDDTPIDVGDLNGWSLRIAGLGSAPTTSTISFTNSTPVPIPDNSIVTTTFTVSVPGTQLLEVYTKLNITHTFSGDLDITLTSPAGTTVTLTTDNGGSNDDVFNGTTFRNNANPSGLVPYSSNNGLITDHIFSNGVVVPLITPEESLGAFRGENPNGTWTLTISDDAAADLGTLNNWELNFITSSCTAPVCTVTCPANITVSNDAGVCGAVVNYPAPTSGGTCGPISTFPNSGTVFPVGANTVNAYNGNNHKIWGLTASGQLVSFNAGTPSLVSAPLTITGLAAGEKIVGIDYRPLDGVLYGMAADAAMTTGRLYTINTSTGAATAVNAATTFAINGTNYGFDFNPTVDRIRVVSNTGLNIRLNPATGGLAAADLPLNPGTPQVGGAAYTNSYNGATTTTLYVIDAGTDMLYIQNPPNNGTLTAVGPLGFNTNATIGFDITPSNRAIAALNNGGSSNLYTIDLTTGAATLVGTISGVVLEGIAAVPFSQLTPSCSFTITVNDVTAPTITCPANITATNTTGLCSATVNTPAPTTSDNCSVTKLTFALTGATVATSPTTGINTVGSRSFNVGVTTVTYTAFDAANNASTCSFTVTVTDTQNPTITCPANQTGTNTVGLCSGSVTTPNPVTADNCAVSKLTWVLTGATTGTSPATGINNVGTRVFNVGVTTVTYTVTDAANNSATCSFTVTVTDTQNPAITCPANITATTPVGSCTAVVNYSVTATDNCPGVTTALQSGLASGSAFPLGVNTVTWRATDAAGNTSTCSFTVTVLDGQLPVISVQPQSRTACVGSNVTFSVTASNTLSYKWQQFSGGTWNDIAGATASSYTVSNVQTSMNTNTFRVLVTGLCSTVTSATATLFVNTNPIITLSSSIPPALLPGQFLNITATGIPPGGSYVWLKDGVVLAGITGSTLSNLGVADIGSYQVRYTDLNGCVTTSAALVVSGLASGGLWVYPNPNAGSFNVRFFNTSGEVATVNVYDSKGSRVYQKTVTTTLAYTQIEVNLGAQAPNGTYTVELVNGSGKRVGAKQIIIRQN